MSPPRVIKTIDTGAGFSLGDLLRFTDILACDLQDNFGQAPFTWVLQYGDRLSVLETQWEGEVQKRATVIALRNMLASFPEIVAYSAIFEVWMAAYAPGSIRPTARIENDLKNRKNMLMLDAFHRDGRHRQKWYECTADPNGRMFRKEVKLGAEMQGAGPMHDLFRPEVPMPPGTPKVADT